jgi:hypothetical protein
MKTLLFAAIIFTLASLAGSQARADGLVLPLGDNWQCSPVAALTGYQYNVKTQVFQQGVSFGAGVGCRWTGWKVALGVEAVGSFSMNNNAPNAGQGNLILTVADNFGIGPGVQVFKDPVTGDLTGQMLISFFVTASWASTIDQLARAKQAAVLEARASGGLQP